MNLRKKIQHIFIIFLTFFTFNLVPQVKLMAQNSSAYNDVRNITGKDCDYIEGEADDQASKRNQPCYTSTYNETEDKCTLPDFKFAPFGGNDDMEWNYGNDACLGYMLGAGAALQIAFGGCRIGCPGPTAAAAPAAGAASATATASTTAASRGVAAVIKENAQKLAKKAQHYGKIASSGVGSPGSSTISGMPVDVFSIIELGIFTARCFIPTQSAGCCPAAIACTTALGTAIGVLGGIFETAKDHFYNVNICGTGWKKWKKNLANNQKWEIGAGYYQKCLAEVFGTETSSGFDAPNDYCTSEKKNKSQQRYCELTQNRKECHRTNILITRDESDNIIGNGHVEKFISDRYYREYLYGGIEYEDNSSDSCENPKPERWEDYLGYRDDKQKYYFRGPNQTPNFACKRFLQEGIRNLEGLKAYNCCNEKSQKTTCIERVDNKVNDHKVCSLNGDCGVVFEKHKILTVKYKIFESERNPNYICAKTYTVCPYDHNVAGGTDYGETYYYNPKIITNFCQQMNHCTKIPPITKYSYFDPDTFFFSESCQDLRGDSQFINVPGSSKYPSLDFSTIYSRNFSAPMVQCFKETLENNFLQKTGKTTCIDLAEKPVKTKERPNGLCKSGYTHQKGDVQNQTFFQKVQNTFRIPIKIALVLSVTILGFNILLATPESFINKKTVMTYLIKFGLVYFFVLGNAWQGFFLDSVMNLSSEFSNITFRPKATKESISGDDGCLFPKYDHSKLLDDSATNVSVNPSYPPGKNYLRIWDTLDCKIARALGYAPEASTPNLAKMIFAGFLTGGTGITFFFAAFVYAFTLISIVIRAVHITVMSIIGIILLIYVSPLTITCALFERTKGIFENWWKQMLGFILQPMILFAYLGLMLTVFDSLFIGTATFKPLTSTSSMPEIDCTKHQYGTPDDTSIYCILNFAKFKNFNGLEVFDLAIPVLDSLNKEKINTLFRAAVIMFVLLKFLDKITSVAKKLVGGAELDATSTLDLKGKIESVTRGLQTRALNATKRLATKQIPKALKSKISGSGEKSASPPSNKSDASKNGDSVGGGSSGGSSGGNSDTVGGGRSGE
jgi:type IV secretory pathway VirB6-like protein